MKMSRPLSIESASLAPTILCGSEPLEPLRHYGRILSMVVGMHLDVRSTDVDLITRILGKEENYESLVWIQQYLRNRRKLVLFFYIRVC